MQLPIQAIDPSPVAMHQIRHRQVRPTANNYDDAGGGVGQPAAARSALPVPDDPLDGIMQFLGTENGFAVDTNGCAGAWFDDFRDGDMEMLLDLPDTIVLTAEATETATRAEAAAVPDRLAVMNLSSLSSGDDMDEDEGDDAHWLSSSDSSSDDEAADAHWLPSKSKKRGCRKRRLQHQQSTPAGQRKQQMGTVVRPAPHGVVVAVEGGGGGNDRWCRHCGTVETPLWRAGPEGPKTLCNACGLRYKNKLAPLTAKRRQAAAAAAAAKPSGAKSKSHSVLPLVGDATVMRKKRSLLIRID